jgi:hypothetical protein
LTEKFVGVFVRFFFARQLQQSTDLPATCKVVNAVMDTQNNLVH